MCEMLKSSAKNPRSPQNFRDAALVFAHTGRPQNMAWGEYTLHCYSIVMFHSYVSYAIFMENILFMAGFLFDPLPCVFFSSQQLHADVGLMMGLCS